VYPKLKSKEFYINQYRKQKKELSEKGELWRLCVETEELFIIKLNNIFEEYKTDFFLNDFHRESSTLGKIGILLQKKVTVEEMKAQFERSGKEMEKIFKDEIPYVKDQLKKISSPLKFNDIANIYRWIWRKQITLKDLNESVLIEFKKTKHFNYLKSENKL